MSFFTASKSKEDLQQSSGSSYLTKSGCYPVNLIAPFANASRNGSISVDLFVDHKDQHQVIYGNMRITNNDGTPNQIGSKVFNQLAIIADVEDISDPVDGELPIGKANAMSDVSILEDLADIDVLLRIQMEYSTYNGNIQEKKIIKGFFRASDNASAEEIVNETTVGEQFDRESVYFENVTYKDGLDEESVEAWIAQKRPKGTAGNAGGSAPAGAAKKPAFGKKRGFGQ